MTTTALLQAKHDELSAVERALAEADAAFNAEAVATLTTQADVLRRFISRLTVEACAEAEEQARERAETWLAAQHTDEAALRRVAEARAQAEAACDGLIEAVRAEQAARRDLRRTANGIELLVRRFDLPRPAQVAEAPERIDYLGRLLTACDSLLKPTPRAHFDAAVPVSATAEERRTAVLRACARFLTRSRSQLPEDVVAICEAAPIPDGVLTSPAASARPEAVRGFEQMYEEVRTTERALALLGPTNPLGRGL